MTSFQANAPFKLPSTDSDIPVFHVFDQEDIDAVEAALAARRPLLVRGEPGVGKTQLAQAAAQVLGRGFCKMVVDARSEARDLKWREDLVARLADAQMMGTLPDRKRAHRERGRLDPRNYVAPGPLWWAFDWDGAARQAHRVNEQAPPSLGPTCDPANGVVILIDEIDKAEPEVPNGLLEALGAREFTPTGRMEPVRAGIWPLVVITTNEERRLPDAFLRRCVVHDMSPPSDPDDLKAWLVARGKTHFAHAPSTLLKEAADQTVQDRQACEAQRLRPLPGQAEYLDLLRAVLSDEAVRDLPAAERLNRLAPYFLKKHPELRKPRT
ncbi:AAA family ATPase [Rhodospirillum sp. A1_3_36]|uniref:AAA family ATPase n=1 Tax=Rhodospirillum sp. A1_3_36 TaxID=3391666 RepID=UPI0039A47135